MSFTTPDVPVADDDSEDFQRHLAEFLDTNTPDDLPPVGTALGSVEDTSPQLPDLPDLGSDQEPPTGEAETDSPPAPPQESAEGGEASSPGSSPPPPLPPEDELDSTTFVIGDDAPVPAPAATAPTPVEEPAPAPAPVGPDYERIFNAYFPGVEVTAESIVELLDFGTRVQSLSPERQRILNAAFSDNPAAFLGDLVPKSAPASTPPPAQVRQQNSDPWDDEPAPVGPDPHVAALEARLAQMEVQAQAQQQAAYEAQIQQETQLAGQGYESFRTEYPSLDETDLAILKTQVTQKGLYPALLRANNGDPAAAYRAALETAMLTNPVYKDHALRGPASSTAPAPPTPEEQTRVALASAVSASTSSPLSKVEAPKVAESTSEMKDQINDELKRIMQANQ